MELGRMRDLWRSMRDKLGITNQDLTVSYPKGFRLYETQDYRLICVCTKCAKKLNGVYVKTSSDDIFKLIEKLKSKLT